jgi:hypothetical protein
MHVFSPGSKAENAARRVCRQSGPPQMQRIGSHNGERRLCISKRCACSECRRSHGKA